MTKLMTKKLTVNYPLGDFLTRVKNSAMAGNKRLEVPVTKLVVAVAECLKKAGYFDEVKKTKDSLSIALTFKDKKPLITDVKLVSKPGRRIYLSSKEIGKKRGPSRYLISTPKGIMTTNQALKSNMGGEVIAEIF